MNIADLIRAALVEALNAPISRPPALRAIPHIRYPSRQVTVEQISDDVFCAKIFHRYKARTKAVPIDAEELRITMNALLPNGLYVQSVEDASFYIELKIRRYL